MIPPQAADSVNSSKSKSIGGIIAGSVVGAAVVVGAGVLLCIRRRRRLQRSRRELPDILASPLMQQPYISMQSSSKAYSGANTTGVSIPTSHDPSNTGYLTGENTAETGVQPYGINRHSEKKQEILRTMAHGGNTLHTGSGTSNDGVSGVSVRNAEHTQTESFEVLRSELDNLRRDMERMQENRMAAGDAPPEYTDHIP